MFWSRVQNPILHTLSLVISKLFHIILLISWLMEKTWFFFFFYKPFYFKTGRICYEKSNMLIEKMAYWNVLLFLKSIDFQNSKGTSRWPHLPMDSGSQGTFHQGAGWCWPVGNAPKFSVFLSVKFRAWFWLPKRFQILSFPNFFFFKNLSTVEALCCVGFRDIS